MRHESRSDTVSGHPKWRQSCRRPHRDTKKRPGKRRTLGRNDGPARPDLLPDAPGLIETGANPERSVPVRTVTGRTGRSSSAIALAGVAIILTGWLVVSLAASIVESYRASPALGTLAVSVYGVGTFLIAFAASREWRALRSLRRGGKPRGAPSESARGGGGVLGKNKFLAGGGVGPPPPPPPAPPPGWGRAAKQ